MLKVRGIQFDALASAQVQSAHDLVVAAIWRRRLEFAGKIDLDYVRESVAFTIEQCQKLGSHRMATWIGFAGSLLKDEIHPMSITRRDEKAQIVCKELAGQSLFATLKALEATAAAGVAADPSSDG
jgi:hypothetical protein